MMHYPLTLTSLFERAGKLYPEVEIVSRRADNSIHRYAYRDWHARTKALAAALQDCGIQPGDRVATLMWNHYAHLEAYFAIPVIGGVLHTLNLRLHPDELTYVIERCRGPRSHHRRCLAPPVRKDQASRKPRTRDRSSIQR